MDDYANPKPVISDKKLLLTGNSDETCGTFVIADEDHTLGNALRYILSKSRDVEFCGYSLPHPSEASMHLRIQTNGKPVQNVLKAALENLVSMCDHMDLTYKGAIE